jgi:hypothetical protein
MKKRASVVDPEFDDRFPREFFLSIPNAEKTEFNVGHTEERVAVAGKVVPVGVYKLFMTGEIHAPVHITTTTHAVLITKKKRTK